MSRLEGKVALITGAGSGIGRATAERFAEEGALVACADWRADAARATAEGIGGRAIGVELDVTKAPSIQAGVARTVEEFGGLDVLVCNAGVTIVGSVMDLSEEEWDQELTTNLKSVFLCAKAAWEHLVARGGGSILGTASMAGQWAIPADAAYCASKAGVIMLTKCMALDGAKQNVRANCVCPGYTPDADHRGLLRSPGGSGRGAKRFAGRCTLWAAWATRSTSANAFVYLASDEAAWVTGTALVVDGGITAGVWGG